MFPGTVLPGPAPHLSPNERRIVFVRRTDAENLLLTADVDGSAEQQVASWRGPGGIRAGDWSPDGKTIVYAVESFRNGRGAYLVAKAVEGAAERTIPSPWRTVDGLRWLPNGRGLLVTADRGQIWHVSYPDGRIRPINNDLSAYSNVTVTADSSVLVAAQRETDARIWVVSRDGATPPRPITDRVRGDYPGVDWLGNEQIVYAAPASRRESRLWILAADGSSRRQLSPEGFSDAQPSSCGDSGNLVFASSRGGLSHIWTSKADGGNALQLTFGGGEFFPSCSPDASWVTYGSMDPKS